MTTLQEEHLIRYENWQKIQPLNKENMNQDHEMANVQKVTACTECKNRNSGNKRKYKENDERKTTNAMTAVQN